MVFREHKAALVVRMHDSAVQESLSPPLIRLPKRWSCINTADGTGQHDETLCCVEPFGLHPIGGASQAEDLRWLLALLGLRYSVKQGVPKA